jgi:hypothetical protein
VAAAGAFAGAAFGGWDSVWVQWRKIRTRENEKEISCFILFGFFMQLCKCYLFKCLMSQRGDREGFYCGFQRMRLGAMSNFSCTNLAAASATNLVEK